MSRSTNGSSGFGSSPTQTSPFGSSIQSPQPAFGSSIFGSSTPFGASSQPASGSTGTPAFGAPSTPAFGANSTPAFGTTSTPAFGATSTPAFGSTTTPTFGQSIFAFGTNSLFRSTRTTSAFGESQTPTQVASYSATTETDGSFGQFVKLESISAMPVYRDKGHEELRWEDYQLGDKGGPLSPIPQSTGMAGSNSSTTQTTNAVSPFRANSTSPFCQSSFFCSCHSPFRANCSPQPFGSSLSPFGANSSSQPFGASTSSPLGSSIFGNTQSSPLFSSSTPTNPQSGSANGQNTSPFGQTGAFSQPSLFNLPSSGLAGSIFSSSASLTSNALAGFGQTAASMSPPFQTAQPAQSSGTFTFNFDKAQSGTQTPTQAFANTDIGKENSR